VAGPEKKKFPVFSRFYGNLLQARFYGNLLQVPPARRHPMPTALLRDLSELLRDAGSRAQQPIHASR